MATRTTPYPISNWPNNTQTPIKHNRRIFIIDDYSFDLLNSNNNTLVTVLCSKRIYPKLIIAKIIFTIISIVPSSMNLAIDIKPNASRNEQISRLIPDSMTSFDDRQLMVIEKNMVE